MEIGRLCVKTTGRDAGRLCVIVDTLDKNLVLIDGNVRRRKCNVAHLEPLAEVLKLKKGASHTEVSAEFKKFDIPMWNTKAKPSKPKPAQVRKNKSKDKPAIVEKKAEKPKTKAAKKE